MNEEILRKDYADSDERIDQLEKELMENADLFEMPLHHSFVPGFYIRTIFMPKGIGKVNIVTTLIHSSLHPFHISQGKISVQINKEEWETLEAPYSGITEPGTRRVIIIHEDCIFTTFHPISADEQPKENTKEAADAAVERIVKRISQEHVNKHVGGVLKNNVVYNKLENETQFY